MDWTLHPINRFPEWRHSWDILNQRCGGCTLLSADFVESLLTHFPPNDAFLAVYGSNDTTIDAMAIVEQDKAIGWSSYQPSQAPLGLWLQAPKADTSVIASSLLSKLPGVSWILGITQQDPQLIPRPDDCDENSSTALMTMDYIDTASLETQGEFDTYFKTLSKNHRQNLRRQRNRLEREGITTRLEVISDADQVGSAIDAYGTLESAGWKQHTDTAIHRDNTQGQFYTDLLKRYMGKKSGAIFKYYYGDQVVAMDLAIEHDDLMILLKTTYDESIKTSSPAQLMHQEIFEYLFRNGNTNRVEFYGKVMDWHLKWTKTTRSLFHMTHYAWPAHYAKKALNLTQPVRNLLRL